MVVEVLRFTNCNAFLLQRFINTNLQLRFASCTIAGPGREYNEPLYLSQI